MVRLETCRQQHRELLDLVTTMLGTLTETAVTAHPGAIHLQLTRLSRKLSVHLRLEDESLYPALLQHPDDKVRSTARRFMEEMGGLDAAFQDYMNRWHTFEALRENPGGFIKDSRTVFETLAKRMAKEDIQLYPLATSGTDHP